MTYYLKSRTIKLFLSFVLFSVIPTRLFSFSHEISVCYFDESQMQMRFPKPPNFVKGRNGEKVDKGFMLFYEKKLFDLIGLVSFYIGGDVGKWSRQEEGLYSATMFLSSRINGISLLFFHPYLEYSLFGPTVVSKDHFASRNFGSRFLLQNFLGAGVEIGKNSGISINAKMIRYFLADMTHPKEGFEVPILLSVGYHF